MTDYNGLSEREANEKLAVWWQGSNEFRSFTLPEWDMLLLEEYDEFQTGKVDVVFDGEWFTRDLNAVALLEKVLDAEQRKAYYEAITGIVWPAAKARGEEFNLSMLIILDAPTRVQALLRVIGIEETQ